VPSVKTVREAKTVRAVKTVREAKHGSNPGCPVRTVAQAQANHTTTYDQTITTTSDDFQQQDSDLDQLHVEMTPELAERLGMTEDWECQCVERDSDEDEVAAVNEEPFTEIDITFAGDSGCADHIANSNDLPGYGVKPSAGSRAGKGWVAADGMRIPNEGEADLNLVTGNGKKVKSKVQVGRVSRPLMSIARICDADNTVLFNKTHAIVHDAKGREVCRFDRKGQLYLIKFRLKAPDRTAAGFPRPGTK
jgi:hypothetical protein